MDVSIIVPLYKGRKFLKDLSLNIEECINKTPDKEFEVIVVNDYPDEIITYEEISVSCNKSIINLTSNVGIHGARLEGLNKSSGEYILFLDQDDYLRKDYFRSQLQNINNADAIVCKLLNGNREHYTNSFKFEDVISKDFLINNWCSIVSPGQVLIKKKSIPCIWKENILFCNGADDYFLWLAMFCKGKKFELNNELLFEHRISGFNTSMNTNSMMDSEIQMIEILLKSGAFCKNDNEALSTLKDKLRFIHIKQLDNINIAYQISIIMENIAEKSIYNKCGKYISIYGAGDIGKSLYKGIKKDNRLVISFIDQNAEYINIEEPVYKLEDAPENIDTIIIAVNGETEVIRKKLQKKYMCKILLLEEFIQIIK